MFVLCCREFNAMSGVHCKNTYVAKTLNWENSVTNKCYVQR